MHARVVRFTDVSRIRSRDRRGYKEDGPPGVDASGMKLLVDESQGTAIFVGFFDSEQKLRDASAIFDQMDSSETPGTRASVDLCEVKVERTLTQGPHLTRAGSARNAAWLRKYAAESMPRSKRDQDSPSGSSRSIRSKLPSLPPRLSIVWTSVASRVAGTTGEPFSSLPWWERTMWRTAWASSGSKPSIDSIVRRTR